MRHFLLFRKIFLSVVIASMLSLPLADITEDSAMTAFENPVFDVAFMTDENLPSEEHFLRTEVDLSINIDLAPAENLLQYSPRPRSSAKPAMADLYLKEIIYEIIIPPKIAS